MRGSSVNSFELHGVVCSFAKIEGANAATLIPWKLEILFGFAYAKGELVMKSQGEC